MSLSDDAVKWLIIHRLVRISKELTRISEEWSALVEHWDGLMAKIENEARAARGATDET